MTEPTRRCEHCHQPITNKPVKICDDCKLPISRSHKYTYIQRDGHTVLVHRHCNNPTSYTEKSKS